MPGIAEACLLKMSCQRRLDQFQHEILMILSLSSFTKTDGLFIFRSRDTTSENGPTAVSTDGQHMLHFVSLANFVWPFTTYRALLVLWSKVSWRRMAVWVVAQKTDQHGELLFLASTQTFILGERFKDGLGVEAHLSPNTRLFSRLRDHEFSPFTFHWGPLWPDYRKYLSPEILYIP